MDSAPLMNIAALWLSWGLILIHERKSLSSTVIALVAQSWCKYAGNCARPAITIRRFAPSVAIRAARDWAVLSSSRCRLSMRSVQFGVFLTSLRKSVQLSRPVPSPADPAIGFCLSKRKLKDIAHASPEAVSLTHEHAPFFQ